MAILNLAGAERLRNKSVQAEKKAASKQCEDDEKIRAEADGAHGNRAVRQMANHYRVDDRHAHPAEFCEDKRQRQTDGGSQFDAECLQSDHSRSGEFRECTGDREMAQIAGAKRSAEVQLLGVTARS